MTTRANRIAWEAASLKHVREYDELLASARAGGSLTEVEHDLLDPLPADAPAVVHLQSGHGLDDVDPVRSGARPVVGVDYSTVAASAARRRAAELGLPCHYVVSALPGAPPADSRADLVYTGLRIHHLGEHPEPFWRMDGVTAAWNGRLPNTFSLLASRS